jgi:transaldolase
MKTLATLRVKIYADGADKQTMLQLNANPLIKGMTTNPTLMRRAGLKDFEAFARDILQNITDKPISLEVFSDEFPEMRRQAMKISSWGKNVYVKIPVTNTRSESSAPLIRDLAADGMKLNVTAIATPEQVDEVVAALHPKTPAVVSLIAGRIADSGLNPMPQMRATKKKLAALPHAELLWASVREVLNIYQADECGCDIVTVPHDILHKAQRLAGVELKELSLDTVKMFATDAAAAGFKL